MLNVPQKKDNINITFFVPCYNEEQNIVQSIKTINNAARIVGLSYEILIIDDCSKDNSVGIVEKYLTENPNLNSRLFKNQKHRGLSCNYTDGAFLGKGEYYIFYGASNVTPEEDLVKMLKKIGTVDMVIPFIQFDERDLSRKLLSRLFTIIVNGLSGFSLKYYNGNVIHKRYNVMRWHADTYGYSYQAEILVRLLHEGATYLEVGMTSRNRKSGKSKALSFQNLFSVSHSLLQIFFRRVRKELFQI